MDLRRGSERISTLGGLCAPDSRLPYWEHVEYKLFALVLTGAGE